MISYWAHHEIKADRMYFIGDKLSHETQRGEVTVILAEGLGEELKAEVVLPERIIGSAGRVYAEYFPGSGSGLIFRLPEEFMNVHRCSAPEKNLQSSEWMSRPLYIPAVSSVKLNYSITAVPEATAESLKESVRKMMRE
jgi:hypothetical protein